jgi:hypothetical protein
VLGVDLRGGPGQVPPLLVGHRHASGPVATTPRIGSAPHRFRMVRAWRPCVPRGVNAASSRLGCEPCSGWACSAS